MHKSSILVKALLNYKINACLFYKIWKLHMTQFFMIMLMGKECVGTSKNF